MGTVGTVRALLRPTNIMKTRPWIIASAFVWTLVGAVALAAYSGHPEPVPSALEHDHASHAGQPHVDAATAPGLIAPANSTNRLVPREIKWEDSFEGAMKKARAQNKPILVDFYADWCGPCKLMEQSVYPDRNVIAQSQNWVTVKVNGEKRPDVMQAYGISGYPTLLFAHSNGQPVASTTGYLDAPQLVQQMQAAFSTWSSTKSKV